MTEESTLNTTITGLIAGTTYSVSVVASSSTLFSKEKSATITIRKFVGVYVVNMQFMHMDMF